jgi:hypothetical protein
MAQQREHAHLTLPMRTLLPLTRSAVPERCLPGRRRLLLYRICPETSLVISNMLT